MDYFENFAVEKSVRKELKQEIKSAAASFKSSTSNFTSGEVFRFLKTYSASALSGKVIAVDPVTDIKPSHLGSFLFSYKEDDGQIDYFIVNSFMKSQLAILDIPELLFGLFTTFSVFAGILILADKREKFKELQQTLEVKHEEIRRVLEEHEALALLGRMAATLAHELKTPIATISNLIQTFPSRINDKEFTDRFHVMIKEELNRTQQLINNLLAYGKDIDSSHGEWISLAILLKELSAKNSLRLASAPPWEIYGDRFYLGLLLENLMRNSREAGAAELRVTLQTETTEGSGRAEILFEDNGKGFPEDADLGSLLTPFVSGRSSGAGLGLYLVAKIAAAHDAQITLYRPAHGAGVRLSLPRKKVRPYDR
jgi:signal transduction histidine kinase